MSPLQKVLQSVFPRIIHKPLSAEQTAVSAGTILATSSQIATSIISMWIIAIVIVVLKIISYFIFPPIYMVIGEILEMNLFDILINIIIFGGLIFLSVYHIDKKLDIV